MVDEGAARAAEVARLRQLIAECRRLAATCRDAARSISLRTDREILLEMARRHDAQAELLESRIPAAP